MYYEYNYIGKFIKWHRAHSWQQTRTLPTLHIKLALHVLSYYAKIIIYNCLSPFNSCLNPFIQNAHRKHSRTYSTLYEN